MHVLIKGFVTNMPELMSASGAPGPLCLRCLLAGASVIALLSSVGLLC